jgi:hypothetical protein
MGFFDRFRKKPDDEPPPAEEPAAEEEPPPDVVAMARRGMDVPPDDYLEAILRVDCPGALQNGAVRVGLSQPTWPTNASLMDSTVSGIARAVARQHGCDPGKSSWMETKGPDGAGVILVMLWK